MCGATLPPFMVRRDDVIVLAAVFMMSACGASDERGESPETMPTASATAHPSASGAPGCEPGAVATCTCTDGTSGQQACGSDARLGPCQCALAGPLVCGGTTCRGKGTCGSDGRCPAFLGECFTKEGGFDTCGTYCQSIGATCAEGACSSDGTAVASGYTWVSYSAAAAAECAAYADPEEVGFDQCRTPIWLQPTKPLDDIVRCCCAEG